MRMCKTVYAKNFANKKDEEEDKKNDEKKDQNSENVIVYSTLLPDLVSNASIIRLLSSPVEIR